MSVGGISRVVYPVYCLGNESLTGDQLEKHMPETTTLGGNVVHLLLLILVPVIAFACKMWCNIRVQDIATVG